MFIRVCLLVSAGTSGLEQEQIIAHDTTHVPQDSAIRSRLSKLCVGRGSIGGIVYGLWSMVEGGDAMDIDRAHPYLYKWFVCPVEEPLFPINDCSYSSCLVKWLLHWDFIAIFPFVIPVGD